MSTNKQTEKRKGQISGQKLADFFNLVATLVQEEATVKGSMTSGDTYRKLSFNFPNGLENYRKLKIEFIN